MRRHESQTRRRQEIRPEPRWLRVVWAKFLYPRVVWPNRRHIFNLTGHTVSYLREPKMATRIVPSEVCSVHVGVVSVLSLK